MRRQRFKYRSRGAQIHCLEALREFVVHGRESLSRVVPPVLLYPQTRETHRPAQLPEQSALLPCDFNRLVEAMFRG